MANKKTFNRKRINNRKRYTHRKKIRGGADLSSNLNKLGSVVAQTGQNAFDWSINELAEYTGVDPNKTAEQVLSEAASKVENINAVLKSPQGERLMSEVNDLASDIGENVLSPAFEKVAQTAIEKSGELGQQAVKTGLDVVGMLPGIGEVVEGVRTISDVVRTGEKVVEAGAEFTGIAADATNQLAQKKEEASGIISEFTEMINNGVEKGLNMAENLNNTVASNLQEKQDNLAKQFDSIKNSSIPNINPNLNENLNNKKNLYPVLQKDNVPQFGGTNKEFLDTLLTAQRGGRLAANRALKSQYSFLRPRYTRKQMVKKFYKSRRK
ncbi:MAG: hypothetical protein QM535_22520 [Limnohabitans sp.]|nr:hypothetical protein [Limnohabitans sp.]